jgi:hypothetical protein
MIMGLQIRQFVRDLTGSRPHMGATKAGLQPPSRSRAAMQIIVSLALLGFAFYVLLAGGYSETVEKVSTGLIGTVGGYWLH